MLKGLKKEKAADVGGETVLGSIPSYSALTARQVPVAFGPRRRNFPSSYGLSHSGAQW